MKKEIENINEILKGKPISRLFGENTVFCHKNLFYKIPSDLAKKTMYKNINAYDRVCESFKIITQNFGDISIIPQTEIIQNEDRFYIIRQSAINGEKLSHKHLKSNPQLSFKFKKIIERNKQMWEREGYFLDLLGSEYFIGPRTLHNLITDGTNIYIFDFGLFEKSPKSRTFKLASHAAKNFQSFFIKQIFLK